RLPPVLVFETGANEWRTYDSWPPKATAPLAFYLDEGGKLAAAPPREDSRTAFDEYTSDPDHPVPFTAETRTTEGHLFMVEDQRFASTRPDVLTYQTAPLDRDLTIAGPIQASLTVSTTGTDSDWVVKLIDVYPGNAPDPQPNPQNVRMGGFQ